MSYPIQRTLKILLTGVAVLLALTTSYRHLIIDAPDLYKCNALEAHGRWVDTADSQQFISWQPPGCPLHTYDAHGIDSCLKCKTLSFVGDSAVRQVFWATARKLDRRRAEKASSSAEKHSDLKFKQGCVQIDFHWDPFLNLTDWKEEVIRSGFTTRNTNATRPTAILVGTGLWHAKELGSVYLDGFKQAIDSIAEHLPHDARNAKGVIMPPSIRGEDVNLVLFAPVLQPSQAKLDPTRAANLTPGRIQKMNDYLSTAAMRNKFDVLWSYSLMTRQKPSAHEKNGIHVVDGIAERQSDIFLNVACNGVPTLQRYPFDKTCCAVQPFVNKEQRLLILIAVLTAAFALYRSLKPTQNDPSGGRRQVNGRLSGAAGTLALALLYCVVADRTAILDRLQKVPNQQTFLRMVFVVLVGGIFTLQRGRGESAGRSPSKLSTIAPVHTFLSRKQTDEWKGWMQFGILAYHYTGMSRELWVYQLVRLMVASYLFMTGYGHTLYFLKTNIFSLHRVAAVLVRVNLLSCLLAYLMQTDYDFYYFPAISSFWFLVVYLTIRVQHQPNVIPRVLVLKVFVSALIVQVLIQTPGILEFLFDFLTTTCKMHLDVQEVRFRLSLDGYVVYVGMLAAAFTLQLTGGLPCSTTCLATQVKKVPVVVHVLTIITSGVLLPGYFIFTRRFEDKYEYNRWHPIISPLPVLAFVMLRNASRGLRNFHSQLFAWLGRFSLETFVLQYHIWLAADTKALLSFGLWTRTMGGGCMHKLGWVCDFILVTAVFMWTSWAASDATTVLTSSIVGAQTKDGTRGLLQHTESQEAKVGDKMGEKQSISEHAELQGSPLNLHEASKREADTTKLTALQHEGKDQWLIVRLAAILFLLWLGNQFYS